MRLLSGWIAFLIMALPSGHFLRAGVIADSIAEFSLVQGQSNWRYGIFDQTAFGAYKTSGFANFDTPDAINNIWRASDDQASVTSSSNAENNEFLRLSAAGGHPTGTGIGGQDRVIWAIRRYTSEVAGLIQIDFDLRKENFANANGGGITGRIFVDGIEQYRQFIGTTDGVGVQSSLLTNVQVGSFVDFVIDPLGVPSVRDSDPYSPRADGTHFSAVISTATVPEPGSLCILGLCALSLCATSLRKRQV